MQKGFFITFEGIEGSGKSTQARMLYEALKLKHKDRHVIFTREPGGTILADQIRSLLLVQAVAKPGTENSSLEWEPESELLLYLVARIEHLKKLLLPALARGCIIICDRFIDSTFAYQAYARGFGKDKISQLHQLIVPALQPDLTVLLDLDPKLGLNRANERMSDKVIKEDRFEQLGIDFHIKVREGFLALAAQESKRITVIDANESLEMLHEKIYDLVETKIK